MGKVYVLSQSSRVDLPKMPAFAYCEAWIWVSDVAVSLKSRC